MGMFSNIRIAKETLEIISAGEYVVNGKTIGLPENDFKKLIVYDAAGSYRGRAASLFSYRFYSGLGTSQ